MVIWETQDDESIKIKLETWNNDKEYYKTAFKLANAFRANFEKFESYATEEIRRGGPQRYAE